MNNITWHSPSEPAPEGPIRLRRFDSYLEWLDCAVKLLRERLCESVADDAAVMLSGGATPVPVYAGLAAGGYALGPDIRVIMSDERMAPPDSPQSNAGNLLRLMSASGLTPDRMLTVNTALDLQSAAEAYHCELEKFLDGGGRITLGLLGLGADGHTASLFSSSDVEAGKNRYAVPVKRPVPPHRVSVTPVFMARAERIVVLTAGPEKERVVRALISEPSSIPAGLALAAVEGAVELWHSPEAAPR